jgi:hypothetical protein
MSLCAVTKKFEGAYLVDTGKHIQLDSCTLLCHFKGGKSKSVSNEEKGWLLPEVFIVIKFAKEVANHSFPLNHK